MEETFHLDTHNRIHSVTEMYSNFPVYLCASFSFMYANLFTLSWTPVFQWRYKVWSSVL